MNYKIKVVACIAILLTVAIQACRKDVNPDAIVDAPIVFDAPQGWPQPVYKFENNPLTQAGFTLGRKLFYDKRLSRNNTVSCGSCHQQFAGFSHLDHPLSHGIDGLFGTRNAPSLANLAWYPAFMWDGGVNHIENQPQNPLTNPVEMDITIRELTSKLNRIPEYRTQFQALYGGDTINSQKIFRALSLFMGAMVSNNSKYDKYINGVSGVQFTADEQQGLTIFRQHCERCHKEPLFTDFTYRNNGLAPKPNLPDYGRAVVTGNALDNFAFKVPTLRNVALSRPYMHDGRFNSLNEVLEHYKTGITHSPSLDSSLINAIPLTPLAQTQLLEFLNTLTDSTFISDKRFSEL